jgi:hypothetical protein
MLWDGISGKLKPSPTRMHEQIIETCTNTIKKNMNKKRTTVTLIILCILALAIVRITIHLQSSKQLVVYNTPTEYLPLPSASQEPSTSTTGTVLHVEKLRPGITFGQLTISTITPFNATHGPLSNENAQINFEGMLTVEGEYYYYAEGQQEGMVFFAISEKSLRESASGLAPNNTKLYIKFANQQIAKKAFGPKGNSGTAVIVIDNLKLIYYSSELQHSARLMSLREKK